jgi:hypothetical protein
MVEGIRTFLNPQHGNTTTTPEEEAAVITINPAIQRHFELKIKTLQDASRDAYKLEELLQIKQRHYKKATLAEEVQPLVTEIEMLKFVLFLVRRTEREKEEQQ